MTKSDIEVKISALEENLMTSAHEFSSELNIQATLLAQARADLDKARTDVERLKNEVGTIKTLQANYDVKTSSEW